MWTMNERARLSVEELLQLKWLMGGLLALLSLWSLFSLSLGAELFLMAGVGAVVFALLRPQTVARIPERAMHWAGPGILCVIALDFALNIGQLPEFMPQLVRMVVLLLVYRVYAPRRKREDLQLVLLCLFGLVISGVLTVSLLFAFQILLFTPAAMALLFVICLLDRGSPQAEGSPQWQHFHWGRLLGRVWKVMDVKIVLLGTAMFLFVVAVSSLLFVLTPRVNLDRALPFLQVSGQARSGFGESVEFGEVVEIMNDNTPALRVDVPSEQLIGGRPYWRMLVLDEYEEGVFRMSPHLKTVGERIAGGRLREADTVRELSGWGAPSEDYRNQRWTFYLEGGVSRYLPLLGPYQRLRFQGEQDIEKIGALRLVNLTKVLQKALFYQVEGLEPVKRLPAAEVEIRAFERSFDASADGRRRYPETMRALHLGEAERAVLAEINAEILPAEGGLTAVEYSEAATDYLRRNFGYSLRPDGGTGEHRVIQWLEGGTRGHCELFAGAFLLLARDAGYPARMVVGFAGGGWNSVEEYFLVRNSDAHAWVEIYDESAHEWLRADPTPGGGPSNPDVESAESVAYVTGWGAWIDSLRIQWYRRIVNFEQQDQVAMADGFREALREIARDLRAGIGEAWTDLKAMIRRPFSKDSISLGGLILGTLILCYLVWRLRFLVQRGLSRLLRHPERMDPIRKQAARYLRRVREREERLEGDSAVRERLGAVREDLERLRFGPEGTIQAARTTFGEARRALRGRGG